MENLPETTSNPISQGCGPDTRINVQVSPTTGGDFFISIESNSTVENLKKLISKRLKVPRDRICLLFRDKQLQEGSLIQYGITDGSKITLLPNVETGLITQRPEIGIMQALESLNETQVNEFLCGKAPLNLSMRLGDHMMLIQLQLSTVASASKPPNCAPLVHSPGPPNLMQASKNLQHTLRKLSADIFSGRERTRSRVGDCRENVYSGTFSGALSPTLQDSRGRPRRDVATIVHILNDLLSSVPELRRVQNKESNEVSNQSSQEFQNGEFTETCMASEPSCSSTPCCSSAPCCPTLPLPKPDQNSVTRNKLDQLRLVMGERRERRRQRKAKPYTLPQQTDSDTVTA